MRIRRQLAPLAIAVLTSACFTAVPGAAVAPAGSASGIYGAPLGDPTEEISAQDMTAHFGISIEDARRQMLRQADLIRLSQRIAGATDPVWAGAWIDHLHGGALVVYTTDAAATREALTAESGTYVSLVQVQRVDRSYSQLDALAGKVRSAVDMEGVLTVGVMVDQRLNNVRVQLPAVDQLAARGRDASAEYATVNRVVSKFTDVVVSTTGGALDAYSCNSQFELCDPPLRGGAEIQSDTGHFPTQACTAGLVVYSSSDFKPYVLTAGHCIDPAVGGTGNTITWFTGFANGVRHDIGKPWPGWPPVSNLYDDEALIKIDNPAGWGLPRSPIVLVVASGGTRPTARDEAYPITAVGDNCNGCAGHPIPVDGYLCWTGSTYQTDCGRFDSTVANTGYLNIDNFGVCGGDSGAPVFAGNAAYGIISSGRSTTTVTAGAWRFFFMPRSYQISCTGYGAGNDAVLYHGMSTALSALNVQISP